MAAVSLIPQLVFRAFTDSGAPLSGGKVHTYFAGSSTKATTWSDSNGTVANLNPVVLNARGEADIYLEDAVAYKFVIKDSSGITIDTVDNVVTYLPGDAPANGYLTKVSADDANGGYLSGKIIAGDYATVNVNNPGASETLSIGFVPDWRVNVSDIDSPDYLEQKVRAGANVTVTKQTGMGGEYLEISASGAAQWETVTLDGTDFLTPVAGLPQDLIASNQIVVGADPGTSGNRASFQPDALVMFNATAGVAGYITLTDAGILEISGTGLSNYITLGTGETYKVDVGGIVSDTMGRIVNSGTEIVLTVTDYDGGGLPTVVGNLSIGALGTTLGNAGKLISIDAQGVKPSTNSGVDYTSVLSIDANGAVQKGTITASGIGALPDTTTHGDLSGLADDDHLQYLRVCATQTAVTNYTFDGTETRGQGWASDATGGNRTINIDADLFSTGFEANICKWDASANTVTLDAGAGNTIDGAQTYVLTKRFETVTLLKDGASTWKIKSNYVDKAWFDAAGTAAGLVAGYIAKNGTTTTTASIPFAAGASVSGAILDVSNGATITNQGGTVKLSINSYTNSSAVVNINNQQTALDGRELSSFEFYGQNSTPASFKFGRITTTSTTTTAGSETGAMSFWVNRSAGSMYEALAITISAAIPVITPKGRMVINTSPFATSTVPLTVTQAAAALTFATISRADASVADIGRINYQAQDSGATLTTYARTRAALITATDGAEDGAYYIDIMKGQTVNTNAISCVSTGGVVTNTLTGLLKVTGASTLDNLAGAGSRMVVADSNGLLSTTAIPSAGVSSVSAADSTLTITPTTGAVTAKINLDNANTWTANQTVPKLYTGQAVVEDWYTTYARFANKNANSDQGFGLVQDNAGQVFLRGQTYAVIGATTGYYLEVSVGAVTPYDTGASTLGSASKRWGATYLGSLDVSGNTTLGDASSDTLTVNATSTFNAPVTFGVTATDTVKFNASILGTVAASTDANIDFGASAKRFGIAWFKAFVSRSASATNVSYYANTTADTTYRFNIDASGKHIWGAGGVAALDTNCNLYRYAADALKTDGAFIIAGNLTNANLAGTGSRMVVADTNGLLGTQAVPSVGLTTITTRTGSASTSTTEQYIRQTGSADYTESLPAATGSGRVLRLSNRGTGTWTIDPNASETINGESTVDLLQYDSITIIDAAAGLWEVV